MHALHQWAPLIQLIQDAAHMFFNNHCCNHPGQCICVIFKGCFCPPRPPVFFLRASHRRPSGIAMHGKKLTNYWKEAICVAHQRDSRLTAGAPGGVECGVLWVGGVRLAPGNLRVCECFHVCAILV